MKIKLMNCVSTLGYAKWLTIGKQYEIYKIRWDGYQTLFFFFGDDNSFHWVPHPAFEPIKE